MDVLDNKPQSELLHSVVVELAKASAELRCAQADLTKAKGRLSFAIAVANRLLDKEIER